MKASRVDVIGTLKSPGCVLFLWFPLLILVSVLIEYNLATGSFFPSIRGPYYLVFTGRDTSIWDHPGPHGSELGTGRQGQSLEIIGFVATGGFLHSVVVTFSGRTGFIRWYGKGHQITCTNDNTNETGNRACLWGLKTQLTEYDYDIGLPNSIPPGLLQNA